MAAPNTQRMGKAYIKVDGGLLETLPGAKLTLGGPVRTAVDISAGNFFTQGPDKGSMLDCTILFGANTSLDAIRLMSNVTITFEPDVGPTYVVSNAWCAEALELDDDGGKVACKFAGPPAKEIST